MPSLGTFHSAGQGYQLSGSRLAKQVTFVLKYERRRHLRFGGVPISARLFLACAANHLDEWAQQILKLLFREQLCETLNSPPFPLCSQQEFAVRIFPRRPPLAPCYDEATYLSTPFSYRPILFQQSFLELRVIVVVDTPSVSNFAF